MCDLKIMESCDLKGTLLSSFLGIPGAAKPLFEEENTRLAVYLFYADSTTGKAEKDFSGKQMRV